MNSHHPYPLPLTNFLLRPPATSTRGLPTIATLQSKPTPPPLVEDQEAFSHQILQELWLIVCCNFGQYLHPPPRNHHTYLLKARKAPCTISATEDLKASPKLLWHETHFKNTPLEGRTCLGTNTCFQTILTPC